MNTRTHTLYSPVARGARARTAIGPLFKDAWRTLVLWRRRARERRALAELPAELLKDIGVSRADAMHEAAKPFWRD